MGHETAAQIDLWNRHHPATPVFDLSGATRLIAQYDPDQISTYETINFVEFEKLSQTPEGLLGYDLDKDMEPNLKLIFAANPWRDPSSPIFYLEGNFDSPLNIYRYQSHRHSPRSRRTVEDIFFSLMYPHRKRTRLTPLTPDETLLMQSAPPFSSFLKSGYRF